VGCISSRVGGLFCGVGFVMCGGGWGVWLGGGGSIVGQKVWSGESRGDTRGPAWPGVWTGWGGGQPVRIVFSGSAPKMGAAVCSGGQGRVPKCRTGVVRGEGDLSRWWERLGSWSEVTARVQEGCWQEPA